MGIFGIGETIINLERTGTARVYMQKIGSLWPRLQDLKAMVAPASRGTLLGSALGILPGGGPILAAFSAYALEKKVSSQPERFGKGALEGVAGPEAANNGAAQTSFIPLLTLGVPANAVMALMVGALMMHGLHPGPQLMRDKPELFWGLIASMWTGNLMLVLLNLPLVGIWAKMLTVPYRYLYPAVLIICCIGVYSVNNSALDVLIATVFGFIGYLLYRLRCEPAPLLLGFILGPLIEENMRRALVISHGSTTVFVERPISATFLVLTAVLVLVLAAPIIRAGRERVFREEQA
jgi:TctA family transporter